MLRKVIFFVVSVILVKSGLSILEPSVGSLEKIFGAVLISMAGGIMAMFVIGEPTDD